MINRYSFRSQSFINTVFLTTRLVTSSQSYLILIASKESTTLVVSKANSENFS